MNNSFADFYSIISPGYCWCVSKHFFMYAVTKTRVLNPTLTQPSTKTIIIYIVKGWKLRRKPPKIPLKSRNRQSFWQSFCQLTRQANYFSFCPVYPRSFAMTRSAPKSRQTREQCVNKCSSCARATTDLSTPVKSINKTERLIEFNLSMI